VIGNALLSSGGRIAPARAQNTFAATMEAQGDQLMMEADGIVVVLEYTDAANFDFSRFSSVSDLNQAEFSQLVACDLDRLPLLVGGGTSQSDEGTPKFVGKQVRFPSGSRDCQWPQSLPFLEQ
jgi:hypothetical protein